MEVTKFKVVLETHLGLF